MVRIYRYEEITDEEQDERVRRMVDADDPGGQSYRITIYQGEAGIGQEAEAAYAIYYEDAGRLGIAWGSDPAWADVPDLETGIGWYLNDGDAWDAHN